ncbi:MAG: hypothetical protein UW62_C0030G0010 [Candidatus Collierbacteria bacterium GW2011_GWB1_44_35]|uniref:Uncharacterized protein n=4 Tax=Candidatus Collieribacteriota TaxID=1752725 RepID=A0A0G1P486_9BACT|nr:MAG: hypothetical protein UW23_C0027G0016 [Candidatus Collierbacteria bacterium GW2011_GWA1_44_12]KKT37986.1 MAG: hypothetical protein UW26_C0022G0007 [Candidatus Collierbacteria bacterium GW2011_GWF1_44_12]KKT67188.1 MAG: hypothetical protein UW62_C0030G0010 [Candidatus Collierbacteria bacterium GW2011_GWB1_44_35]KKU27674.1 MAG: hypothetical protein UX41_C0045G0002 [Candidatus Collierbacteria bacterium GW2011_GWE1_46_18]
MGRSSSLILNVILLAALLLVVVAFVILPGRFVQVGDREGQVSGQSTD